MPYKIYSIESRKGGVGKTTVALNLASALVSKKEPVLLLDCDISGTSIEDPSSKSPFWENKTNLLYYIDEDKQKKTVNFLSYFINKYIKGESNVGDFINRDRLKVTKVNIIASSLTGMSGHDTIIRDWYMDELHSYWMMEFIERIIKEFEGAFPEKTVHIIIDNSPGYACFSQALHDYMYKEGPQVAKFLLVSTLDGQDLKANMELAAEINNSIINRGIAANYYKIKEINNKDLDDNNCDVLLESDDDIKDFFFHLGDNKKLIDIYTKKWESEVYLALIINKVPQSLKDDETIVAYKEMVGQYYELFSRIAGTDNDSPKNIVYYDEAIINQYYIRYLRGKMADRSQTNAYWQEQIKKLKTSVEASEAMLPSVAEDRITILYDELIKNLKEHEFAQLSRQLSSSWSPDNALVQIKRHITQGSHGVMFAIIEDMPLREVKRMLLEWNKEQITAIGNLVGPNPRELFCLSDFLNKLELYAGSDDDNIRVELLLTVSLLLYAFKSDYESHLESGLSLKEYAKKIINIPTTALSLMRQTIDIFQKSHPNIRFRINAMSFLQLSRAYSSFCYCFVRWMDIQSDFKVLISAIELYVYNTPGSTFSKEMLDYLSGVFRKRLDYNENRLSEIEANSFMMKNILDVLRENILKAWK